VAAKKAYDVQQLKILKGLEAVRLRPGMYIGSVGQRGLHHLIEEIVANSVDEALNGDATRVDVEIAKSGWVTVADNGRGIPTAIHPEEGVSGLELVLTNLHAGGKFDADGYKFSGGLHGVGASVVNALSQELKAEVQRDGYVWTQTYRAGVPTGQVEQGAPSKKTGTSISWLYDHTIFEKDVRYQHEHWQRRLRELAALVPGLTLTLKFEGNALETFKVDGGLSDFVQHLVSQKNGVVPVHKQPVRLTADELDIALLWTDYDQEVLAGFVNAIYTYDGGTHIQGARSGVRKAINDAYAELGRLRQKDEPFTQEDCREGLFFVLSYKMHDPIFEAQSKNKLTSSEVQPLVHNWVAAQLKDWLLLNENRPEADRIFQRVVEARDGRLAAKKARDASTARKGLLGSTTLPGKLADCIQKTGDTELFIVEGDSAGGGLKAKRDRNLQAVMPLRGKIENAEKNGEGSLTSEAIKDLISAIGGQVVTIDVPVKRNGKMVTRKKLTVDVSQPRYQSICICTDADVDGGHITTLLLTLFHRFAPGLIRDGRVFIVEMPLYRVEHKKRGRLYLFADEELQGFVKKGEIKTRGDGSPDIMRFKGLGEMQPEQLKEVALDPTTRRLRRVTIGDALEADEMTSLLMGSRVEPRKVFIEENALDADLDI